MTHKRKVVAIIGSYRKRETWKNVEHFERLLREELNVDFEYVFFKEYDVQQCRGCFLCLTKGDEFCPHKDERQVLLDKIMAADNRAVIIHGCGR